MKTSLTVAALTFTIAGVATPATADILFSDSWAPGDLTGTIAPGVSWAANASGTNSWGSPGVNQGTLQWPAAGGAGIRDFHISFNLPAGVDILANFGTGCGGGTGGGTVFCSNSPTSLWNAVLDGPDSISFFAPTGITLDPGESYFVNIFFTGAAPSGSFEGSWTLSGQVPVPATLALLGLGLAGLGWSRRRK